MHIEQKTKRFKEEETPKEWYILDASGKTLGRFATAVADILRGKHKPIFAFDQDLGDGVIVINADKIKVSGSKGAQKLYTRHTGFLGGLRQTPYSVMQARKPEYIITHAVKGMVPRNCLGRKQMKRLRVYAGSEHDLQAQKPIEVNI